MWVFLLNIRDNIYHCQVNIVIFPFKIKLIVSTNSFNSKNAWTLTISSIVPVVYGGFIFNG